MMFTLKEMYRGENGFSYVDVMIGITIMLVGVLALASALTANLVRSYDTDKRLIAKQLALSTIESIISARDISRPGTIEGWDSIGNVGTNPVNGVNKGIFLNGWTPIREESGWDGVAGTADDGCTAGTSCAVTGRPTNTSPEIEGYERRVVISDVADAERPTPPNPITRRKIEVTIRYYYVGTMSSEETVATLITDYQ